MFLVNLIFKRFQNITLNLELTYDVDLEYQEHDKMKYL